MPYFRRERKNNKEKVLKKILIIFVLESVIYTLFFYLKTMHFDISNLNSKTHFLVDNIQLWASIPILDLTPLLLGHIINTIRLSYLALILKAIQLFHSDLVGISQKIYDIVELHKPMFDFIRFNISHLFGVILIHHLM